MLDGIRIFNNQVRERIWVKMHVQVFNVHALSGGKWNKRTYALWHNKAIIKIYVISDRISEHKYISYVT